MVAAASSAPQNFGLPPPPPPLQSPYNDNLAVEHRAVTAAAYHDTLPPHPYSYHYGVSDEVGGSVFDKTERQDDNGNVEGEYRIQLPDGRLQIVTYTADHIHGFKVDIKYEGTATYPPPIPVVDDIRFNNGLGRPQGQSVTPNIEPFPL